MATLKSFIRTAIFALVLTSCNNIPDNASVDNYYQLRKQLFKYKGSVDLTAEIKKNDADLKNDSLETTLYKEVENTISFIDSIKLFLINHFKVSDPNTFSKNEIENYSFNDSLFSFASLNLMFCGEGGNKPETKYNAWTLRDKIETYYKAYGTLDKERINKFILYPRDYSDRDGVIIQWEFQHFYKTNLITTLTTLEKVKQDIYLSFINFKYQRRHK